jgi:hypothetical protein
MGLRKKSSSQKIHRNFIFKIKSLDDVQKIKEKFTHFKYDFTCQIQIAKECRDSWADIFNALDEFMKGMSIFARLFDDKKVI